ncbi:MAG: TIGR03084 family metal-binding protein [Pseudonocardia sp.]|nr:TIGR03084 family metal-binding protein [Pseudonocardia sp.]
MPVSMDALADDLAAESAVLRGLLAPLQEHEWRLSTPAAGWNVGDQVAHLAYFDDVAVRSATDPDAFVADREKIEADGGISPDTVADRFRGLTGTQLLPWFDEARERLVTSFRVLEPSLRVPWFGPPMSAASSLTARIMETWAHGQDIADTVGVTREMSPRLRHVAHIGIGARAYSYAVNEVALPAVPIRVELDAPDGSTWTWGPDGAPDRVTGPALDFCLAVTQRRHRDDTALTITGPAAIEWMTIAQAFAGAAGTGRAAGQFAKGNA